MKKDKNLTLTSKKNQLKVRILEIKERIKWMTRALRQQYNYVPYPQGHKRKQHNKDTSRGYKKEKMEFLEMKGKLSGIRNSLDKIDSSVFISEDQLE